jgi:hypothetical protein
MAPVDTLDIIAQARHELMNKVAEREEVDKRIAELRLLLRSLVRFMPDQVARQEILDQVADAKRKAPSLTESISGLLSQAEGKLTANEIREQLEAGGFDLDEYSQPLATVQSTLQRLADAGKVGRDFGPDKSVVYVWKKQIPPRGTLAKAFAEQGKKK